MDASHRSVSNSLPNESDENEENQHQAFANSQTLKKPSAKNYMSSTISAASKAVAPRKKILAERNEADSEPNHDSLDVNAAKKNPILGDSGGENSPIKASQFSDDDGSEEFLYKPYDPVTNYLSPRPQFLRFNPNRRREILRGGEGSSSSSPLSPDSASMVTGGILEDEEAVVGTDEVFEESEEVETDEEEEEEKRWCCVEGVRTVVLLLVLGLSVVLITALNCSTPYCALNGVEGGYLGEVANESHKVALFVEDPESGIVPSHRLVFTNVVEEGNNLIHKRSFEEMGSGDEVRSFRGLGSGESDSKQVAGPVFQEASDKVVGDSENKEGLDSFEKVEVSQDQQITVSLQHQDAVSSASDVLEEQILSETCPVEEFVPRSASKETMKIVEILQQIEAEFALKILIGVVTFVAAVAYFFLGIPMKAPIKVGRKDSSLRAKPPSEPPNVEQEKMAKRVHFSSPTLEPLMNKHSDQVHHFTTEKETEEYSQSHAPSVELLSELVVREIKSSVKKNITTTESQSVDSRSEFSTMDSPLFGSYNNTAEKKPANNKQEVEANFPTPQARRSSRNNEASSATTPVRRSSRIRIRSVMSP